jgi:hypothetical protein
MADHSSPLSFSKEEVVRLPARKQSNKLKEIYRKAYRSAQLIKR